MALGRKLWLMDQISEKDRQMGCFQLHFFKLSPGTARFLFHWLQVLNEWDTWNKNHNLAVFVFPFCGGLLFVHRPFKHASALTLLDSQTSPWVPYSHIDCRTILPPNRTYCRKYLPQFHWIQGFKLFLPCPLHFSLGIFSVQSGWKYWHSYRIWMELGSIWASTFQCRSCMPCFPSYTKRWEFRIIFQDLGQFIRDECWVHKIQETTVNVAYKKALKIYLWTWREELKEKSMKLYFWNQIALHFSIIKNLHND